MGAKYLPTIKDLKASQRFQQQQQRKSPPAKSPMKPEDTPPAEKRKGK